MIPRFSRGQNEHKFIGRSERRAKVSIGTKFNGSTNGMA